MKRRDRERGSHDLGQFKELLAEWVLKAVQSIPLDIEIAHGRIKADGDPNAVHEKKRDVWTWFEDGLSGARSLARLFIPAGILFNLPGNNDGAHLFRGRKQFGPGGALVAVDGGDGETENVVPGWLDKDNAGLSSKKKMHVESTGDDVELAATASGKTVNVNGNTYKLPKFPTFESDFATAWNLLISVLQAGTQGSPAAQQLTALSGALAQLQQFGTNLTNGSYDSDKAKNG